MSRNRMANARNMYQGSDLKVLCVCSAGLLRSPTMARLLHRNYDNVNARPVGFSTEYALIPMEPVHLFWAELVLCADDDAFSVVNQQLQETGFDRDVYNLGIPDNYDFGDKVLEGIIQAKFDQIQELKDQCLVQNN